MNPDTWFYKTVKNISYFMDPTYGRLSAFLYELFMFAVVIIWILPFLIPAGSNPSTFINWISDHLILFYVFYIIDFSLRWVTYGFRKTEKYQKYGKKIYFLFPINIWSLLDITSMVAYFIPSIKWLTAIKTARVIKTTKISPIMYSGITFVFRSMFREWKALLMVILTLSVIIFIGTIIIYELEKDVNPEIKYFGDALWFVFITVTTIGYGDITPVTELGRIFAAIFAVLGIITMALVTGIAVAGFTLEAQSWNEKKKAGEIPNKNTKLFSVERRWFKRNIEKPLKDINLMPEKKTIIKDDNGNKTLNNEDDVLKNMKQKNDVKKVTKILDDTNKQNEEMKKKK